MKCKDCKYWGSHEKWLVPDERGNCDHPDPMWTAFGEGCTQEGIETDPEFGCIQYEALKPHG